LLIIYYNVFRITLLNLFVKEETAVGKTRFFVFLISVVFVSGCNVGKTIRPFVPKIDASVESFKAFGFKPGIKTGGSKVVEAGLGGTTFVIVNNVNFYAVPVTYAKPLDCIPPRGTVRDTRHFDTSQYVQIPVMAMLYDSNGRFVGVAGHIFSYSNYNYGPMAYSWIINQSDIHWFRDPAKSPRVPVTELTANKVKFGRQWGNGVSGLQIANISPNQCRIKILSNGRDLGEISPGQLMYVSKDLIGGYYGNVIFHAISERGVAEFNLSLTNYGVWAQQWIIQ
jgi:hypothetical protein